VTSVELGEKLEKMYESKGFNKTTMIHLFGIIYADEMRNAGITPAEVVKIARIPKSYQTEVNKGMNLSKYVEMKQQYKDTF